MTPNFDRDTALTPGPRGAYTAHLPSHWSIGRGTNGGLIAAVALQAGALELGDPARKPRSLTVHFLAPAEVGELELRASVERSGRRVSNVALRLAQNGTPVALALAAFAVPSGGTRSFSHIDAPPAPPPDSLEPIPTTDDGLAVMRNFEFRFAFGELPFTQAPESRAGIWVRTARPRRPDALALAAFSDCWAPMPFTQLDRRAGAPTLDLTIHFRDHEWYELAAPDAFVLASFRSQLLADGLFEEDGELWNEDGVLVAQSRQLAMLIE